MVDRQHAHRRIAVCRMDIAKRDIFDRRAHKVAIFQPDNTVVSVERYHIVVCFAAERTYIVYNTIATASAKVQAILIVCQLLRIKTYMLYIKAINIAHSYEIYDGVFYAHVA